jgi:hypothetical protein
VPISRPKQKKMLLHRCENDTSNWSHASSVLVFLHEEPIHGTAQGFRFILIFIGVNEEAVELDTDLSLLIS